MIKKYFDVTLDNVDLNKVDLTKLKLKHKSPFMIQKN